MAYKISKRMSKKMYQINKFLREKNISKTKREKIQQIIIN